MQPVLYYNKMDSYLEPKEVLEHSVGIAINVGDVLTFKVLTKNDQVLCRSVVRPADDKDHPNLQAHKPQGEGDLQEFQTKVDTIPIVRRDRLTQRSKRMKVKKRKSTTSVD